MATSHDRGLVIQKFKEKIAGMQVESLSFKTDLLHGFACWCYNIQGMGGSQLLELFDKPWKWTPEFNNEFLPWHICEMDPGTFKGKESYLAAFIDGAGDTLDDPEGASSPFRETTANHTYAKGLEDGYRYREEQGAIR